MDTKFVGMALIAVAVLSLTAAQILIKSRLGLLGAIPLSPRELLAYGLQLASDWAIWIGIGGLLVASLLWYAAISRLPLSVAYPFAALSYPLIFFGSLVLLRETFSWQALGGNVMIVLGVLLVASSTQG